MEKKMGSKMGSGIEMRHLLLAVLYFLR